MHANANAAAAAAAGAAVASQRRGVALGHHAATLSQLLYEVIAKLLLRRAVARKGRSTGCGHRCMHFVGKFTATALVLG